MPGYNHKKSCQCGWCVKEKKEDHLYANLSYGYGFSSSIVEVVKERDKTPCWWCGELVYYHSNGYGDSVLFDEYAPPWPVHECYRIHQQRKKERKAISDKFFRERNRVNALHDDEDQRFINEVLGSFASLPTEGDLANRLGLSVLQLRKHYGHCYNDSEVSDEDWREMIRVAFNRGLDFKIKIEIDAQIALDGGVQTISFDMDVLDENSVKVSKRRRLNITIPPGLTSARWLRVREQGCPSYSGGSPGDLYIFLDIIRENSAE